MKRYSISYPCFVNEHASKSGIKFYYSGRTDNPEEQIERYKNSKNDMGLRIVDSLTKKVVFEDLRPIKGKLILTLTDGDNTWTHIEIFVDLGHMREREHLYTYGNYGEGYNFRVVNVEREICR